MAREISVTFTDGEAEQIDLFVVRARNGEGGPGLKTAEELIRHATNTYLDFVERMNSGQLDGLSSARLLTEQVPGIGLGLLPKEFS